MSEVIEKKEIRILNPQRMGLAEQMRRDWVVNAEEGTTVEQVLDPQYWAHMASQMTAMDSIEVRLETGEWILKLRCINCGRNWAQVYLEHRYDLDQRTETMPTAVKHKVEWKGPQNKFCVIRLSDNEVIQKGMEKSAAYEWLAGYEKTAG